MFLTAMDTVYDVDLPFYTKAIDVQEAGSLHFIDREGRRMEYSFNEFDPENAVAFTAFPIRLHIATKHIIGFHAAEEGPPEVPEVPGTDIDPSKLTLLH